MANEIIKRIDLAVGRLCTSLHAIYTNFFDQDTLQESRSQLANPRYIIPIGTYACGVWESGEDVHLVCISNNTASIFWNFLKENLCLDVDTKLPSDGELATIELSATQLSRKTDASKCFLHDFVQLGLMEGVKCKFYLHYAEASKLVLDRIFTDIIPFPPIHRQSTPSVCNAIIARDIQIVARDLGPLNSAFASVLQDLRKWAHIQGLIGVKFGFLESNDFVWLAHGTLMQEESSEYRRSDDARGSNTPLEAAFDRLVSHIRLQPSSISDEAPKLQCRTMGEERIVRHLSFEGKEAIIKADPRSKSTDPWRLTRPEDATRDCFLKVAADCWAPMLDARADFQENVVPRNINKLVEAIRHATHSLRIWPTPIVRMHDQTKQIHAIGINFTEKFAIDLDDHIDYLLDYDRTIGFIKVTGAIWKDFDALIAEASKIETTGHDSNDRVSLGTLIPSSKSTKFRTAHAVISRLKYDPKHTYEKYEVGHEDRFVEELVWTPLEEWGGKAVEDENFIPEHRIRQLRRSKDKTVMWDRAKRVDLT